MRTEIESRRGSRAARTFMATPFSMLWAGRATRILLTWRQPALRRMREEDLKVNEFFQTAVPRVYAPGDVIGFPALAATSMEQGRLATAHMFGSPFRREAS